MTATSSLAEPLARDDEISPHTHNALDRIATGWRIRYVGDPECPIWVLTHGTTHHGFSAPKMALAEYMRLTRRAREALECPCSVERHIDPQCCAAGMCARDGEEEAAMREGGTS
jgi:hypothetical protein